MEKNKWVLIAVLVLIIGFLAWGFGSGKGVAVENKEGAMGEGSDAEGEEVGTDIVRVDEESLHELELEIISPVEEVIIPGQARLYRANLSGNTLYDSVKVQCEWRFYVNENNDEVLYEEMNNSSNFAGDEREVCGFTSTFIDKVGKLRVELTAILNTFGGEELERVVAEREYVVAR